MSALVEPLLYRAVVSLQAALNAIQVADDYFHSVDAEVAVKLDPSADVHDLLSLEGPVPFVILEPLEERRTWFEKPDGIKVTQPFLVHWCGESEADDDASRMRNYFRACADIERAVRVDPSRGGIVMETLFLNPRLTDFQQGARYWAVCEVQLVFYRTHGDAVGAA